MSEPLELELQTVTGYLGLGNYTSFSSKTLNCEPFSGYLDFPFNVAIVSMPVYFKMGSCYIGLTDLKSLCSAY